MLVQGASVPQAGVLPDPLIPLARRQAITLSDAGWRLDVNRLIKAIGRAGGGRTRKPARAAAEKPVRELRPEGMKSRRAGPLTVSELNSQEHACSVPNLSGKRFGRRRLLGPLKLSVSNARTNLNLS